MHEKYEIKNTKYKIQTKYRSALTICCEILLTESAEQEKWDIEIRCIISISAVQMYRLAIEKSGTHINQWTQNKG